VDFQDHREAAIGLEVRRERDPGFDLPAVMAGGNLHLFHARHLQIGQHIGVELGQHFGILAVHADSADLGWPVGEARHIGDDRLASAADAEAALSIGTANRPAANTGHHLRDLALQVDAEQRQNAMVF